MSTVHVHYHYHAAFDYNLPDTDTEHSGIEGSDTSENGDDITEESLTRHDDMHVPMKGITSPTDFSKEHLLRALYSCGLTRKHRKPRKCHKVYDYKT